MSSPENWTPEERRLHDALHRAADRVQPGPDGLAQIRRRTAAVPLWRRPVVLGLAGATALAVAVIVGGVALLGGTDDEPPVATATSSPPPSPLDDSTSTPTAGGAEPTPSEAPTTASTQSLTVPVYYVAAGGDGPRLVREFHAVETSLSPIGAAVQEMISAPAADPDYSTLWPGDVQVQSAEVAGDVIAVDLTGAVDEPADDAELAVQQLVYTATAAAANSGEDGSLPVRITVDGAPAGTLFGSVGAGEPIGRADPLEVRQLVQLNEPGEGATVSSPVTFSGEAAVFEATVLWELRRDGEVVDEGFTTATECCTFAPFELELELEPGNYEIVMSESDPSDGEGRPPMSDSRAFTVQ